MSQFTQSRRLDGALEFGLEIPERPYEADRRSTYSVKVKNRHYPAISRVIDSFHEMVDYLTENCDPAWEVQVSDLEGIAGRLICPECGGDGTEASSPRAPASK